MFSKFPKSKRCFYKQIILKASPAHQNFQKPWFLEALFIKARGHKKTFRIGWLKLNASEMSQIWGREYLLKNIFPATPFRLSENTFLVEHTSSKENSIVMDGCRTRLKPGPQNRIEMAFLLRNLINAFLFPKR